jgi:phospholipid-binding lipoprotein MlaA
MNAVTRAATAAILGATLLASGCATTGNGAAASTDDPFEPWNRAMYAIHEPIQDNVVRPATQAYVDYVPAMVRQPISNFFNNIDDAFSALNGFLQGKPDKWGHDLGRVIINTAFGLGGLIDIASDAGIPRGEEDFGQTFGYGGIPQGPYFFVPLWGPTTLRDGTGWVIRYYLGPVTYLVKDVPIRNVIYGAGVVDLEASTLDAQKMVDQAAIDKYSFIRRSYLQRRAYLTYDGKPPPEKDE